MPRRGGGRTWSVGRRRPDADVERINEIANGLAAASMAMYANDDEIARQAVDETLEQASTFLSDAVARAEARAQRRKVGAWATGVAVGAVAALAISLPPPGTTPQQTPLATDERPIDPFDRPADIRFPAAGPGTTEAWLGDREATIPEWDTVRAMLPGDAPTGTDVTGGATPPVEAATSETGSLAVPGRAPEPASPESDASSDLSASSAALITGLLSSPPQQVDQVNVALTAETGTSEASSTASEPMAITLSTTSEPMTTTEPTTRSEPATTSTMTTSEPMTTTGSLTARPAPDPSATTAQREAEPIQVASMDATETQPATAASPQERTTATSSPAPQEAVGPPRRTAATPPPQAASQPGRSGTSGARRADRPVVAEQQAGRGRSGAAPRAGAKVDRAPGRSGGVRADSGRPATKATAKNAHERSGRGKGKGR